MYLEQSTKYKEVMSKSKWNLIQDLKTAAYEHQLANSLLAHAEPFSNIEEYNETVIFWEYDVDGYKVTCKYMLDRLVIDHNTKTIKLIDLKTTSHIGSFDKSIETFNYNRQFAFYCQALLNKFKGLEDYKREIYVIALQIKELPECKVFKISDELIEEGHAKIATLMTDIAWHFNNDQWKYSKSYYESNGIDKIY